MKKAIFLDKDGTLVHDVPYNVDPDFIKLIDGVPEALRAFKKAGYLLVMVTNQSGIARGHFTQDQLRESFQHINMLLKPYDACINMFYFCPHHTEGTVSEFSVPCSCRKPLPGLLQKAASDFNIDLRKSWMIGDILHDVEAGNRAGCRTALVDTGNETEWLYNKHNTPHITARTFDEASEAILRRYVTDTNYNNLWKHN